MIKSAGRFMLLLLLCLLFVYAPEILSAVSEPYMPPAPQRTLLRIVLCAESEDAVSIIYKHLSAYQKAHPGVHLRVLRAAPDQLSAMSEPYPDVVLCPEECLPHLPGDFAPACSLPDHALQCAIAASVPAPVSAEFAAYLYEAQSP